MINPCWYCGDTSWWWDAQPPWVELPWISWEIKNKQTTTTLTEADDGSLVTTCQGGIHSYWTIIYGSGTWTPKWRVLNLFTHSLGEGMDRRFNVISWQTAEWLQVHIQCGLRVNLQISTLFYFRGMGGKKIKLKEFKDCTLIQHFIVSCMFLITTILYCSNTINYMQDYFFPFYATILLCNIFVLMEGNLFRLN